MPDLSELYQPEVFTILPGHPVHYDCFLSLFFNQWNLLHLVWVHGDVRVRDGPGVHVDGAAVPLEALQVQFDCSLTYR